MISFLEKLRGFVEGFALRFVQDSHQIFFFNLGSGIAKDSVIFANDLGWIRIPKKGFGLITIALPAWPSARNNRVVYSNKPRVERQI